MSTAIQTQAHGKVILLGEHSVVYGHPALACGLPQGAIVTTVPGAGRLCVEAWQCTVDLSVTDERSVARAYRTILATFGVQNLPVDLHLHFNIPTGAGLGSSAAMAVAIARAVARVLELPSDDARIAQAASASEVEIHGHPSGVDQAFAESGCAVGLFTKAGGLVPFRLATPFSLIIGHSGLARDTKGRVARVAELYTANREETASRFFAIAGLVVRSQEALQSGALGVVGAAMIENHRHLQALEVSHPTLDSMCTMATDAGALGAKLTGGGGGGCVIALANGGASAGTIATAWTRAGFAATTMRIGEEHAS
jgi:mevalonate kinase